MSAPTGTTHDYHYQQETDALLTRLRRMEGQVRGVQKMIEDDPTKCERPKFYIGDTPDTPVEKSLWVVDVPRPYNKLELERLPRDELRNPPPDKCDPKADPKKSVCNEFTQTWDVKNLFLCDGAPFASNADKNPTLTIMALAWRACDHLIAEARKGNL